MTKITARWYINERKAIASCHVLSRSEGKKENLPSLKCANSRLSSAFDPGNSIAQDHCRRCNLRLFDMTTLFVNHSFVRISAISIENEQIFVNTNLN